MRKTLLFFVFSILLISSSNAITTSSETNGTNSVASNDPSVKMQQAMEEFNKLSKEEQRKWIKATKKQLKQMRRDAKDGQSAPSVNTLLLVLIALFIPPLAVYLHEGAINSRFWISLVLTLLFFVPGVIYSLIVVLGPPKG